MNKFELVVETWLGQAYPGAARAGLPDGDDDRRAPGVPCVVGTRRSHGFCRPGRVV